MVLTRSCALSAVSVGLAALRQRKDNTVRQQVREWCYEAQAKRGAQRQALVVEDCFMPLLRWVLAHGQGTPLALALAATTLGLRCTGLAVSVVSRGCAIPVAWIILPANQPAAWRCHWLRLLRPASPKGHTVIVLADRGCMPAGCCGASSAWAGTPSCVSMPAGRFALPVTGTFIR